MQEPAQSETVPPSKDYSIWNISTPLWGLFLFSLLNKFGVWNFLKGTYYLGISYYQFIYWMIAVASGILTIQNMGDLFQSPVVKQLIKKYSPFLVKILQLAQTSQLGINQAETINRIQINLDSVKKSSRKSSGSKLLTSQFPSPEHLHSLLLPPMEINAVTTKNISSSLKQAQALPILPPRVASTKNVERQSHNKKTQGLYFGLVLVAFLILYVITTYGGT
jgi:hypothetical protein